jgi:hypothetical protein
LISLLRAGSFHPGKGLLNGFGLRLEAFALSNESLEVLEGVVVHSLTLLLVLANQTSVAVEVSGQRSCASLHCLNVVREDSFEVVVDLETVLNFSLESLLVLL